MKRTNNTPQRHPVVSVLIGCGVCFGVTLLGSIISAVLLNKETIDEQQIGYAVMLVTGISAMVGAVAACRNTVENRIILSLCTGAGYFCLLLIMALILGGLGEGVGVTGLLVMGCSGCAALLGVRKKPMKYAAAGKYRNR